MAIYPTVEGGKRRKMKPPPLDSNPVCDIPIVKRFQALAVDSWKPYIPHGEGCSSGSRSCDESIVMQQDLGGGGFLEGYALGRSASEGVGCRVPIH
jgi:hypothetical protein